MSQLRFHAAGVTRRGRGLNITRTTLRADVPKARNSPFPGFESKVAGTPQDSALGARGTAPHRARPGQVGLTRPHPAWPVLS
eukprot:15074560-Alexandrium_andersonii.AAC.1